MILQDMALLDRNGTVLNYTMGNSGLKMFPWDYRILATVIQATIFFFGFFGNILLILVVKRTRSLHTPTYCYLVSLACADLIVLISAVPEQMLSNHLYFRQWVLGQAGCSILIFGNFLGINAGSLSIIAFSIERYIAVCHTLLAQKICTTSRAKKISVGVWAFCVLYCFPWLGLTQTKPFSSRYPDIETCDFRLSRKQYIYYFSVDITLFYFMPLLISVYLYVQIGRILYSRRMLLRLTNGVTPRSTSSVSRLSANSCCHGSAKASETVLLTVRAISIGKSRSEVVGRERRRFGGEGSANAQAIQMLVMVVVLFALSWLPFRGVLIYNTFAERPWLNSWYMLFAKSAIYVNCSINPVLYNAMNRRFRAAFLKHLPCWFRPMLPPSSMSFTKSFNSS